ncbi:MAG: glycoside hydrolase family 127 protein [Verrucomicrobia bacterium]|nr:glycoside hydrolase family 127 protein [Verrucomicrobiota bacterium]
MIFAAALLTQSCAAGAIEPRPFKVAARLPDRAEVLSPAAVRLKGWLGHRVAVNEKNRLVKVDLEPLLAGFRKKPGSHPWIGEHIGKWMHAATLAWANTGDPELRRRLDYAATELVNAQEPDGYLGTYIPEKRFGLYPGADWDVWSHKYNLIGLLTYYQFTGSEPALRTCRKIGDLLIATFPAKRSIIAAGTHVGMAATSVLEPMVLLYRFTGDERYLEFCRYIVKSWSEPNGPRIIESLLDHGQVHRTANAKAYEMLSNLVGLCELARATGEREWLKPVLNAWQDIVRKRLYLTGATSQGEHFREDHYLPNSMGAHVGEQCVTTTWIQLNWQLLRLTGETRFGHQLEKTFYNQLSAAQRPDGAQWCYFTSPDGTKPYGPGISCCVSSGPRGMALVPQCAALTMAPAAGQPETLLLNLWESMTVTTTLGGQDVTVHWHSQFPFSGQALLEVQSARPAKGAIRLRVPDWAAPCSASFRGGVNGSVRVADDHCTFTADDWTGAAVSVKFHVSARKIAGDRGNAGRAAFAYGPFVLAFDQQRNPSWPVPQHVVVPETTGTPAVSLVSATDAPLAFGASLAVLRDPRPRDATLVTFADAGSAGGRYSVWLRAAEAGFAGNDSLFLFADETRSEHGNVEGLIADGDFTTFAVTYNGRPQREAWFAVRLDAPVTFRRLVVGHGRSFHDGGWFDAAAGKPRLEMKRDARSPWEHLGELASYPATTHTAPAGLKDGQTFTLTLPQPVRAVAVRLIGTPAGGDQPGQAFASCAELQAFAD